MAIAGNRPEHGLRIELEREARGSGEPWSYRGFAATPGNRFALRVLLSEHGDVQVEAPPGSPPRLEKRVRLLMRTLWRRALAEGAEPARRLVRWRADD